MSQFVIVPAKRGYTCSVCYELQKAKYFLWGRYAEVPECNKIYVRYFGDNNSIDIQVFVNSLYKAICTIACNRTTIDRSSKDTCLYGVDMSCTQNKCKYNKSMLELTSMDMINSVTIERNLLHSLDIPKRRLQNFAFVVNPI